MIYKNYPSVKKKATAFPKITYNLELVATILNIPGGGSALEKLLLAGGFLMGAFGSKHAHFPYHRFMVRDYFLLRPNIDLTKPKTITFVITQKGLPIVLKKLQEFGIYLPQETK